MGIVVSSIFYYYARYAVDKCDIYFRFALKVYLLYFNAAIPSFIFDVLICTVKINVVDAFCFFLSLFSFVFLYTYHLSLYCQSSLSRWAVTSWVVIFRFVLSCFPPYRVSP